MHSVILYYNYLRLNERLKGLTSNELYDTHTQMTILFRVRALMHVSRLQRVRGCDAKYYTRLLNLIRPT